MNFVFWTNPTFISPFTPVDHAVLSYYQRIISGFWKKKVTKAALLDAVTLARDVAYYLMIHVHYLFYWIWFQCQIGSIYFPDFYDAAATEVVPFTASISVCIVIVYWQLAALNLDSLFRQFMHQSCPNISNTQFCYVNIIEQTRQISRL